MRYWILGWGMTLMLLLSSLYAIFIGAPQEAQMGIVQKIFYFHVPSAYAMYLGFAVCAVASLLHLLKKDARFSDWGQAGAELGMLFCVMVLVSGPLWARKAWGVYWTWDPRLTTTLLAGLIFAAYLVLNGMESKHPAFSPRDGRPHPGSVERKFASGLAIVGLVDLPVIHYSVQKWRGQHPTVITVKGGGLDPDMQIALVLGFLLFTALFAVLLVLRRQIDAFRRELSALRLSLSLRERADSGNAGGGMAPGLLGGVCAGLSGTLLTGTLWTLAASAQDAVREPGSRAEAFRSISGKAAEQIQGGTLLLIAYATFWVLLLLYVLRLGLVQNRLRKELAQLKRQTDAEA